MNTQHHCQMIVTLLFATVLATACTPALEDNDIPVTTSSEEAKAFFMQGREAMEFNRNDNARAFMDQAIAADDQFALAYYFRATLANTASEWKLNSDLAMKYRDKVTEGEQYLIDMIPAFVANDMEKRLSLAKALAEAYPNGSRAQLVLAEAQQVVDDVESARATLESALSLDPTFSPTYRALAMNFLFNEPKDFAQAENYANTYVEQQPKLADAYIVLGDVYRAQLKLSEARDAYMRAAKVNPESDVAFSKLGHANTFLGNYQEARDDFAIASRNSKGPFIITNMNFSVYTWLYAGEPKRAFNDNTRVINSIANRIDDPQMQDQAALTCYNDRFLIALESGDMEAASAAYNMLAELQREIAATIGSAEFEKTIEAEITELKGQLVLQTEGATAAKTLADKAAALLEDSKSPRKLDGVQYLRGLIAKKQGNYQEALDEFSLGNIDWVQVKFHMAECEEELGNIESAMALYKDVAEWNFNGLAYALVRGKALKKFVPNSYSTIY